VSLIARPRAAAEAELNWRHMARVFTGAVNPREPDCFMPLAAGAR